MKKLCGFLAFASLLVSTLSACSGSNSSDGSVASFAPVAPPQSVAPQAANLCAKTGAGYVFHGACWQGALKAGAVATLANYKGNAIAVTFGKGTPAGVDAAVRDASGKNDITGKYGGKTFPKYILAGEPLVYLDIHNAGAKSIAFPKTLQIVDTVSGKPFESGAACGIAQLQSGQWAYFIGLAGKISNNVVTFSPAAVRDKMTLPAKGDLYLTLWCSGY